MLAIAGLSLMLISGQLKWLSLPVIFLFINFLNRLLLHILYSRDRLVLFPYLLLSEFFVVVYEFGLTVECIKQRWLIPLVTRIAVLPDDLAWGWNQQVLYSWIVFLQLIIAVSTVQFI